MDKILVILLGCAYDLFLNNRINYAVDFALNERNYEIDWFLSGGIKNPNESMISEAQKMSELISNTDAFIYGNTKNNWNYIYDTVSSNTAENFIMANNYIQDSKQKYSDVYVVTSDFHYTRANKIADKISQQNNYKWVLSDLESHDSRYWEKIHIKNVDSDVEKALNKYSKKQ
jgi:hypothetical protein